MILPAIKNQLQTIATVDFQSTQLSLIWIDDYAKHAAAINRHLELTAAVSCCGLILIIVRCHHCECQATLSFMLHFLVRLSLTQANLRNHKFYFGMLLSAVKISPKPISTIRCSLLMVLYIFLIDLDICLFDVTEGARVTYIRVIYVFFK